MRSLLSGYFTKNNLSLCIITAVALLLPLWQKSIPVLIGIWVVLWLFEIKTVIKKLPELFQSPFVVISICFYLIHFAGMLHTENKPSGWFDLEVKFSLLLLPVLFYTKPAFLKKNIIIILLAFTAGCAIAALLCFIRAYPTYLANNRELAYMQYGYFSVFLNPSYFAMYILFSIAIVLHFLVSKESISLIIKLCSFILFAVLGISFFFISSRAGDIAAIILIISITLFYMAAKKKWLYLLIALASLIVLPALFIKLNPRHNSVIALIMGKDKFMKESTDQNVVARYLIIKSCAVVASQNLFLGVGAGDVKDELAEQYKKMNAAFAFRENLNAHNQYLETLLGMGVVGLIALLALLGTLLYKGFKKKNLLLLSFSVITATHFLFESMLNTQAGVVFFAFFGSLLYSNKNNLTQSDSTPR